MSAQVIEVAAEPGPEAGRGMVIVGAGQAGGRAAETLRAEGWSGPITLVGAEPVAPYERPPLSKAVLTGDKTADACALFPTAWYAEQGIDLRLGVPVAGIRRDTREVVLADGTVLPYHRLLLATGAEPRRLAVPGGELPGVHYLRSAAHSVALAEALGPGRRAVVVGGGFIGLEVAASAVQRGAEVLVVEAGQRLLTRAVPPFVAARIEARHFEAGIGFRLGAGVEAILGETAVTAVRLAGGEEVPCDVVIVGIGVTPRTELAAAAGLALDNGIAVDEHLRTSDPAIFAAGDCCSFPHGLFGRRVRLESWQNAEDQGRLAARNMLGQGLTTDTTVPWFWSDQHDLSIQVVGLPEGAVRSVERVAGPAAALVFYLAADDRLVAAGAVGPESAIARDIKLARMMIERGLRPDPALLQDPRTGLKSLLAAPKAKAA